MGRPEESSALSVTSLLTGVFRRGPRASPCTPDLGSLSTLFPYREGSSLIKTFGDRVVRGCRFGSSLVDITPANSLSYSGVVVSYLSSLECLIGLAQLRRLCT